MIEEHYQSTLHIAKRPIREVISSSSAPHNSLPHDNIDALTLNYWDGQVCMTMEKLLTYIENKYYQYIKEEPIN